MSIGKNVRRLREKREISLEAVATAISTDKKKITPQGIAAMEKRDSKRSDYAVELAQFFNVPVGALMSEDFDPDALQESEEVVAVPPYKLQWLSPDEAKILSLYRACGPKEKDTATSVLDSLPKTITMEISRD